MLAPQRGLIATESQNLCARASVYCTALLIGGQDFRSAITVAAKGKDGLPELSNFYCHPGKARGISQRIRASPIVRYRLVV